MFMLYQWKSRSVKCVCVRVSVCFTVDFISCFVTCDCGINRAFWREQWKGCSSSRHQRYESPLAWWFLLVGGCSVLVFIHTVQLLLLVWWRCCLGWWFSFQHVVCDSNDARGSGCLVKSMRMIHSFIFSAEGRMLLLRSRSQDLAQLSSFYPVIGFKKCV